MFENKILTTKKTRVQLKQEKILRQHSKSRERIKESIEFKPPKKNPKHIRGDLNLEFYEDSPELKKVKGLAPEDTYETWVQEPYINQNFNRFLDIETIKKEKSSKNESREETSSHEKDEEENDNDSGDGELEPGLEDEESYDGKQRTVDKTKTSIMIKKKGLELLPNIGPDIGTADASKYAFSSSMSYTRKHIMVVVKLLHLNILKRNWEIAYRCFSLLIRIHNIDIRSIWPLGVEIITRLAEKEFLESQPEGSIDEYKLRTFNSSQLKIFKDEQFITWLQNFYGINVRLNPRGNHVPLPFRMGTRDTPPVYMASLIWSLIMKSNFVKVNEKLSELLLLPPYINDGVYYFLQGFSYQLEASILSKEEDNMDTQRVEKLMHDARKFYQEAKDRNADFPEELVNNELTLIEKRVAQGLEFEGKLKENDNVSDNEDEDSSTTTNEGNNSFENKTIIEREYGRAGTPYSADLFTSPKRVRNPDSEDEDDYNNTSYMNDNKYGFDDNDDGFAGGFDDDSDD